MQDRFLTTSESIARLVKDFEKHGGLYVAFDFDNTVFDYHDKGDTFYKVEELLIEAKSVGCKLILFTANKGKKLIEAKAYCCNRGYSPDFINENPLMDTIKPYYNILLDDRSGLAEAYNILKTTLNTVKR
jgi:hypothetical protein